MIGKSISVDEATAKVLERIRQQLDSLLDDGKSKATDLRDELEEAKCLAEKLGERLNKAAGDWETRLLKIAILAEALPKEMAAILVDQRLLIDEVKGFPTALTEQLDGLRKTLQGQTEAIAQGLQGRLDGVDAALSRTLEHLGSVDIRTAQTQDLVGGVGTELGSLLGHLDERLDLLSGQIQDLASSLRASDQGTTIRLDNQEKELARLTRPWWKKLFG
mgnify:CR=1 FL=1